MHFWDQFVGEKLEGGLQSTSSIQGLVSGRPRLNNLLSSVGGLGELGCFVKKCPAAAAKPSQSSLPSASRRPHPTFPPQRLNRRLPPGAEGTLFFLHSLSAKAIDRISRYPDEAEVLFVPVQGREKRDGGGLESLW